MAIAELGATIPTRLRRILLGFATFPLFSVFVLIGSCLEDPITPLKAFSSL